jgi:hypothetical protein
LQAIEKAHPHQRLICKLFDVSRFLNPTNQTLSLGPFCCQKTLKINKDWLFEMDAKGRQKQKQTQDQQRTHAKKVAKKKLRKEEQGGEDTVKDREKGSSQARKKVKSLV